MEHDSPLENEEQKTELAKKLRAGLPKNVTFAWDIKSNDLIFTDKNTDKTILTAKYDYPPYPKSSDADDLVWQVESRLKQS